MPKLIKPRKHAYQSSPTGRGHVRTKRRDHACPHCAAAFGQASHLITHVRTVHEKRRD